MERRKRKRRKPIEDVEITIKRKKEPVQEVIEVPEEEPKKTKPKAPTRPTKREGDEKKTVEISEKSKRKTKKFPKLIADNLQASFVANIMEHMRKGESIVICKREDNLWTVAPEEGVVIKEQLIALKGKAYMDEVLNPEYTQFYQEWGELGTEEKLNKVTEAGVKWEEHSTSKINVLRASAAYRKHLGITKYKEEYSTIVSRKRVRGK